MKLVAMVGAAMLMCACGDGPTATVVSTPAGVGGASSSASSSSAAGGDGGGGASSTASSTSSSTGTGGGGGEGGSSCVPNDYAAACVSVGYCWYTPDGCGDFWLCTGTPYSDQNIAPAKCQAPNVVVGGCPKDGGQCVALGIQTSTDGWLSCCPPAP